MADTVKQEYELNINCYFVDGDTRIIKLKNPKESSQLPTSTFTALNEFIRTNNALIGDRGGSPFGRITKVERVATTKVGFDLETT